MQVTSVRTVSSNLATENIAPCTLALIEEVIQPEGLKASDMNERHRAMLLDVISEWADIYFAWSGPTTHELGKNGSAYYRIRGPKLVIEFSPQGVGGDPTMHVHTMYRDPTNDYGIKFTGAQ
jgi:hypothetical protein